MTFLCLLYSLFARLLSSFTILNIQTKINLIGRLYTLSSGCLLACFATCLTQTSITYTYIIYCRLAARALKQMKTKSVQRTPQSVFPFWC